MPESLRRHWQRLSLSQEEREFERAYRPTDAEEDIRIGPVRRSRRTIFSFTLMLVVGLVMLLGAALVGMMLFPYFSYRPEIEMTASQMVGRPVTVGNVSLVLTPYPALQIEEVALGDPGGLRASVVRVAPTVASLLPGRAMVLDFDIENLAVPGDTIDHSLGLFTTVPSPVNIGRVKILSAHYDGPGFSLGGFHGEIAFDGLGRLEAYRLRNEARNVEAILTPVGGGTDIRVIGLDWTPFANFPATVRSFEAKGRLTPGGARFDQVEALVFGGALSGRMDIGWRGPTIRISSGNLKARRVAVQALAEAFQRDMPVQAEMSGLFAFDMVAEKENLSRLLDSLRISGSFSLGRGDIRGIDLVETVSRGQGRTSSRGGITQFEQVSGNVTMERDALQLTDLKLNSGLLQALGQVTLRRADGRLSGGVQVNLKGAIFEIHGGVTVVGTAQMPELNRSDAGR